MIRVFKLFCKIKFINVSAKDLFDRFMVQFKPHEYKCPICNSKHPDWQKHSTYERYLISFEKGQTVIHQITIRRFKCSSCKSTHAIIPDMIIPYQSYSLLFILQVMKDYFSQKLTIEALCAKYEIAVSTLYTWKVLFLKQKKIWLGLLKNIYNTFIEFINSFFEDNFKLEEFFLLTGISFMQNSSHLKKAFWVPE